MARKEILVLLRDVVQLTGVCSDLMTSLASVGRVARCGRSPEPRVGQALKIVTDYSPSFASSYLEFRRTGLLEILEFTIILSNPLAPPCLLAP